VMTGYDDSLSRGFTRQDILASRLEECECDAIELRCQGLHTEAIAKLEEALAIAQKIHGRNSEVTHRLCKQVAMGCNAGAAALLGAGELSAAMEALDRANAVARKAPEHDQERQMLQAATHRMVSQIRQMDPQGNVRRKNVQKKRNQQARTISPNKYKASSNNARAENMSNSNSSMLTSARLTQSQRNSSPNKRAPSVAPLEVSSPQASLQDCMISSPCKLQSKRGPTLILYDTEKITPGQHRALRRLSRPMDEVYTHVRLMVQYQADQERQRRELEDGEEMSEEMYMQMRAYFELQKELEDEFVRTLSGPAVACGLTPSQLAELQTRELNPEDYDMLLRLDEQIQKPTVDVDTVGGYESRPVTPSKLGSTCNICLADMELDEVMKVLPCGHEFHKECIVKWLTECKDTCPMTCKLKPDEEE